MILSLLWYAYLALVGLSFLILLAIDAQGLLGKKKPEKYTIDKRYAPKTLVMAPCKGMDLTLKENLQSLKSQWYKNYDLVAIVADERDTALPVIKKLGIKYITATSKCTKCSAKVRSLATAMEKFRNYDVYVIADSDITVKKDWLSSLVQPLGDSKVGLSTMYPYFKPVGGFWSNVKMMWGFVGDSLMARQSSRFGWGGSLAFKRDLVDAEGLDFFKNSEYSVSDDICLTKIAKKRKLLIAFVPEPKPIVNCSESFSSFFEWANRQTALSILGYRTNLYIGLIYYSMEVLVFVSGILLSIFVSPFFLLLFIHYLRSLYVGYKRSGSNNLILAIVILMVPFIYDFNLVKASQMRTITWRGKTYNLRQ